MVPRHPLSLRLLVLALTAAGLGPTSAQSQPFNDRWNVPVPKPPPAVHDTQQAATKTKTKLPASLEQSLYLIRSTLLTLNDANRSGNYTVLRDLAAPPFQARNSAADLAASFSDLRARKFDLFAVAVAAPRLTAPPALNAQGMLRLTGGFPTRPLQIDFDLLFQNIGGQWRLYGISVATPPAATARSAARPPQPGRR